MTQPTSRIDKDDLLARAQGHWRSILLGMCSGLSERHLTGAHGPCPKCDGKDRWRVTEDFDQNGTAICNQCFRSNHADGLAFLRWWHGWEFPETLRRLAQYLGVDTNVEKMKQATASRAKAMKPKDDKRTLADKWSEWPVSDAERRQLFAEFAAAKAGVDVSAIETTAAKVGHWPVKLKSQRVMALEGFRDLVSADPAAVLLYRIDGDDFPAMGNLQRRKTHLIGGSDNSWFFIGGRERFENAKVVWRVEGATDGFALLPFLPKHHAVITAACGAGWNTRRSEKNPPIELLRGKIVVGCGDADEPGQRGLTGFLDAAAVVADRVMIHPLPYSIEETHGKDLRDYLNQYQPKWAELRDGSMDWSDFRAAAAELFDDPEPVVVTNYHWRDKEHTQPKAMTEIIQQIQDVTGGWPRRINGQLFSDEVTDGEHRLLWLKKAADLFGWLGVRGNATVDFARSGGCFTKEETLASCQQNVMAYQSIEMLPHEPRIPGHYYACEDPPEGDGRCLRWLLSRFNPADDVDRDLILLMFASVFWGDGRGNRPAFLITADGRGAGKSTLAKVVGELAGGIFDINLQEPIERIKGRLLTAEGRDKRVALIDNIKTVRLSSAPLEAMITAPVISGHELYVGESVRPNTLVWLLTMNGPGLSKDIAERCVVVKLKRPENYSETWEGETIAFVREHHAEIIGDLLTFLRGSCVKLDSFSRWGTWEGQVLARLTDEWAFTSAFDVQDSIRGRQKALDIDSEEGSMLQDYFADQLERVRVFEDEAIFISTKTANRWYRKAMNEPASSTKSTQMIKQQIGEGLITRMEPYRKNRQRGFLWFGEKVESRGDVTVAHDLDDRIAVYLRGAADEADSEGDRGDTSKGKGDSF